MADPAAGLINGAALVQGLMTHGQQTQDFVGTMFDAAARRRAGRAVADGDFTGAARILGDRGLIPDAQTAADRGTAQQVLTSANSGDFTGAETTAAAAGDPSLYNTAQSAEVADRTQRATWITHAADALAQIPAPVDPTTGQPDTSAREQAFQEHIIPTLRAMGVHDDVISQIAGSHLTDQALASFRTTVSGMQNMELRTDETTGDIIGVDTRTGESRVVHHGTPMPRQIGQTIYYPPGWDPNAPDGGQGVGGGSAAAPALSTSPTVNADSATPVSFQAPVAGPVTSRFGHRTRPTAGATSDHHGMDYGVPVGTVVTAAAPGEVIAAGPDGGLGTAVRIRHADGSVSIYGHLSATNVHVGSRVDQGQAVGHSGATGTVTGPNLHFEVLDPSGHPVNPAGLLHPQGETPTPPPPPTTTAAAPAATAPARNGWTARPVPPTAAQQEASRRADAAEHRADHAQATADAHLHLAQQNAADQNAPSVITDEDVDFWAQSVLRDGARGMPSLGQGRAASRDRQRITHRAAEIERLTGETGGDAAQRIAENRGAYRTLQTVRTRRAQLEQQVDEARRVGSLMLRGMPDAQNGPSPLLNQPYRAILNRGAGNAGVSRFNIAVNTFGEVYARVMTGATGSAAATDSARQRAHQLLNPDQSPTQIRANYQQMLQEMAAQSGALDAGEQAAIAQIRSEPTRRTPAAGGVQTPARPANPNALPPGVTLLRTHR